MSDLEKRKKLLIAEAEVYRELLKLQVYNLRIYGIKTQRKFRSLSPGGNPLLSIGLPVLSSLLFRRRAKRGISWKGWGALAMFGLQLYSRFGSVFGRRSRIRESTAAEEYLSRSI